MLLCSHTATTTLFKKYTKDVEGHSVSVAILLRTPDKETREDKKRNQMEDEKVTCVI